MFRMIQAYQFFNEPVPRLSLGELCEFVVILGPLWPRLKKTGREFSVIVSMAHEMLKHHCNLQHGPPLFHKTGCKIVDISAQGTSNAEAMAQNTVQEYTTGSNTALQRAAKEIYHEHSKPHHANISK